MNIEIHSISGYDVLAVFVSLALFVRLIQSPASAFRGTRDRTRKVIRSIFNLLP